MNLITMITRNKRRSRHDREGRRYVSSALVLLAVVFLAVPLLPARIASAHGGGTPQVTNDDIGPYWVSVWTSPDPAREGQLHVTVSVAEPGAPGERQAGAPILGATVDVTLTPRAGGFADVSAQATNEQSANRLFYEADLLVPAAGDWQVQVDVEGPAGRGQTAFDLTVMPAQGLDWLLVGGIAFLGISTFFFFYAMRSNRSRDGG